MAYSIGLPIKTQLRLYLPNKTQKITQFTTSILARRCGKASGRLIDAQLLGTYQTEFLGNYLGLASMRAIWRTGCAKIAQKAAERCASCRAMSGASCRASTEQAKELSGSMLQVQSFTQINDSSPRDARAPGSCSQCLWPRSWSIMRSSAGAAYEKRRKGRVWGGGQSARWHLAWTIH